MDTERYSVSFFGLNTEFYTSEYISNIWDVSANKIYEESNIYISGQLSTTYYIGQESGPEITSLTYVVVSTRSPVDVEDELEYWEVYKSVIKEVRGRLGNPVMTITRQKIDFFYFREI
jgi:hypothetical protein